MTCARWLSRSREAAEKLMSSYMILSFLVKIVDNQRPCVEQK
ncbi:hypothetical protein GFC30_3057 (plasmid) [Anoxybacillus amylolyticus]|uniref:Uncharacterized protein n=1 Tax=Anoxybacteroides amylolyticum TaxID=294699 RepID=A0A160F842_9BACL|nr:hypothetical protein GFC30_3057 [Anoxybacillus amylolyticus]